MSDTPTRDNNKQSWWDWGLMLRAFGIVLAIYAIWCFVVIKFGDRLKPFGDAGPFGDSFGVINTLFAGLAFAAVAVTLVLTKRQLADQRRELEEQKRADAKRSVQDQFFQMLASWQQVANSVTMSPQGAGGVALEGRTALSAFGRRLAKDMRADITGTGEPQEVRRNFVNAIYLRTLDRQGIELGHYFRLLYHIVRFVVRTPTEVLSDEEKQDLIRILRAHFSDPEFPLIFYNCIHPHGKNFYPLVDQYDLLQNMDPDDVGQPIDMNFYPLTKKRWEAEGKVVRERTS